MNQAKKKKLKRRILLGVGFVLTILFLVTKAYFNDVVRQYAVNKAELRMSILLNEAVNREVVPNISTERIILFETNAEGNVTNVIVDAYQINLLATRMTSAIHQRLDQQLIEEALTMPLGVIFQNPLLNHMGPRVPIKVEMVGAVVSDVVTKTTAFGINNSLIEVLIKTQLKVVVMIPFYEEEITLVTHTPLVIKMVQGEVPHFYFKQDPGSIFGPLP